MINKNIKKNIEEVINLYSNNILTQDIINKGANKLKEIIKLNKPKTNPSWVYNFLNI